MALVTRIALVMALLWLAAGAGLAAEPPQFDTAAYCRMIATGDSQLLQSKLEYCLRTERSAYRLLQAHSRDVADVDMQLCTYVASVRNVPSEGSYGTLVTCLGGFSGLTGGRGANFLSRPRQER